MEHIVDSHVLPIVQILDLDVLAPQAVDQLMDAISLDSPMAEHVVEVPKIVCPPRAGRTEPQMAEQLVEVPTVLSLSLLQQQTVDIPVSRRRGQGGLQGSHPGQGSTVQVVEQIVDVPVRGGLAGFFPRRSVLWSRSSTFEFLVVASCPSP